MKTSTNISSNIKSDLFVPQLSIDDVIERIQTVNNKEIKVVYSPVQKTISAYIIEEGREQLIKPEDLPKELKAVKDSASFQLLLENSYTRASYLSNGDVKLYMEQRGLGGGKEDRTSSYWKKLLSNVKELVEERNGGELGLKAFISYAWEDTTTEAGKAANGKLQRWLEGLRDDLQHVGVSVFLDIGDMHGDMGKRMRENLDESDIILTINTPRYAQRATQVPQTNLGFEYELTLKKAEVNPKAVVTLHYDGELDKAYPETLKHFPRYDCRRLEDYSENLVGSKGLPGIVPTILGIDVREDAGYQSLVKQWREEKLNYLPELNKEFVGRTEQLEKLEKALETKPVQTISGTEGIGKSELALKYANDHAEQYKIVRWINAEPGNLKKEFKQMAQELAINTKGMELSKIIDAIYTHLKTLPNWLLIFDNATDRNSVESYLPKPTEKGQHVIITSRSTEKWKGQVEVKAFSKAEAWEYIHQKLPSVSQSQAMELAHKVQYSPAKLYQAAEYINSTGISLPYYIKTHLSSATKSKDIVTEASSRIIATEREDHEESAITTITQKTSLTEAKIDRAHKDNKFSEIEAVTDKKNVSGFSALLKQIKEKVVPQIKKEQVKVYISYATEDTSTALGEEKNEKVQNWIEKLQGSLEEVGIAVTISSRGIDGNIEPSAEADLKSSDAILLINTPAYKQQVVASLESGLGYEYKLILEKAKEIPYGMLPLLYSGGFGESVPRELWGFLVRDCTNDSAYEENLVAPQNPKGIIPGIYNIDSDDTPEYRSLVQEWRWHKATILPTANPSFMGRGEVLAQLAENFTEAKDATSQRQVVSATGGMGKSELAIVYANKHANEYDMVRWLNTEGDKLSLEFNQLATELGVDTKGMALKDLIGAVHRSLDEIPRYLLIFDNADNAAAIKDYLPPQNKVGHHLIITSRNSQWSNCIVLDTFSEEECWKYIDGKVKDADKHYAIELAKNVGYLPLALSQAVAYINQEKMTIVDYLENYKSKSTEKGADNIMGTWSMSMEKVKEKSPDAAFILEACSYLNPDNIPLSLFEHPGLLGDPIKVQEALKELRSYSLVQFSKVDDQIRVHRLVQDATRNKEKATEKPEKIIKKVAKLVAAIEACYPESNIQANDYETIRSLLPHIESLAENLKPYSDIIQGRSGVRELLQKIVGEDNEGKEIEKEHFVTKISDQLNAGAILQSKLLSMANNGLHILGEYSRSPEILLKVLDIQARHYGDDSLELAVTLTNLGITLKEIGNYAASKEVLEKALQIQESNNKTKSTELSKTLTVLGTTLYFMEEYTKSREMLQRALEIKDKGSKDEAITLTALGETLSALKNYSYSQEVLKQALNIKEKEYGVNHPEVALTLTSLGSTLYFLGEYKGSQEVLERALKIQQDYYGKDHLKVAATLTNLYNTLKALGNDSSTEILERVIVIEESQYGAMHPQVMRDLLKLASDIGVIDEKGSDTKNINNKTALEKAVKTLEAHYGENHIIVATALEALSYQIQELNEYNTKRDLLEKVLQSKEYHYGSNHVKIVSTLEKLAEVCDRLNDVNTRKSTLEKILKIKEYHYGLGNIRTISTLEDLVEIASKEGDNKLVKVLLEKKVLKIKEEYYGKDHQELISSLEILSKVASSEGNTLAQKDILTKILKIKNNCYQPGDNEILSTLRSLQEVLRKLDNPKEKEENATKILEILSKQSATSYLEIIFKEANNVDTKDSYGHTPLIKAATSGHQEVVLLLIDKNANINVIDNTGSNALILAAWNKHEEIVLTLINKGADVNIQNQWGSAALTDAAYHGLKNVVLALIDKGANVNVKNGNGDTALLNAAKNGHKEVVLILIDKETDNCSAALIKAAEHGHQEVVLALIEKGANVNEKDKDNNTALILAAKNGHQEIVSALINRGANIEDNDKDDSTALIKAAEHGHQDIALYLINRGADVNVMKQSDGNTALILATWNGHEEVALALIEKGADVNFQTRWGSTALTDATHKGLRKLALTLIDRGANVNIKASDGTTALFKATTNSQQEVALALIEKGANVNEKDKDNSTPLVLAAGKGLEKVALALIEKGANVNEKDKDNNTALILAAKNGLKKVALAIMNKGTNINEKDKDDSTALIKAAEHGHQEIALLLIDQGADINVTRHRDGNNALMLATWNKLEEAALALVEKGADVNAKNRYGSFVLTDAAHQGLTKLALALIEKGANINVKASDGATALIKASASGQQELALALIEKGANVNVKASDGTTALIKAAGSGLAKVVLTLLEKGANIHDKDNSDNSALISAITNGHKEVVLTLIDRGANVNSKNKTGESAIMIAQNRSDEELVKLLQSKANQEHIDNSNERSNTMHPHIDEEMSFDLAIEKQLIGDQVSLYDGM